MKIVFLLMVFITVFNERAKANDIITQPEAAIYLAPVTYTGQLIAKMGDASIPNPSWHIVQWLNPSPIAAGNYNTDAGASWAFATNSARVQFYTAPNSGQNIVQNTLELAQAGGNLPCGNEFDLFAESNTPNSYKDPNGNPVAARTGLSQPVGRLSTISFQFGLAVSYENVIRSCAINYGAYIIEVGLQSVNGYAMFFQISIGDSRGLTANVDPCGGYPIGKVYCFTTSIDQIGSGLKAPPVGSRVLYNFNVLSTVLKAIAKTPDSNPSDWQISGTYFGSSIQGNTAVASRWDNLKIFAY